jgi:hypothetical protein
MFTPENINHLLEVFAPQHRETLLAQTKKYDELLSKLPEAAKLVTDKPKRTTGILALNGASGAGQSFVMAEVERLLRERSLVLPRMYLLATRPPRPGEGHKNPYIFTKKVQGGFQDIHNPTVTYGHSDIYYFYQSRPGAANAILLADVRAAMENIMYLETVIPTLLHIKTTQIAEIPPWGDDLQIIYLAAPSGFEWVFRLLNREPSRLKEEKFQIQILGRTKSSISDMQLAVENRIPCVVNRHGQANQAAQEILTAWGL